MKSLSASISGATITNIDSEVTNITEVVDKLMSEIDHENHHNSKVFPIDSNGTVTLTAGASNNVWSDWTELNDNAGTNLIDIFTGHPTWNRHITAIVLEDASIKDKVFNVELAYGDDKTRITQARFMTGNTKEGAANVTRVRAEYIPYTETIYYRMQCETANATIQVHLRAHCHEPY